VRVAHTVDYEEGIAMSRWASPASIAAALIATMAVLTVLVAPVEAAEMTVGQFVQELAKFKNLRAEDERAAADALAGAGFRLPAGLDHSKILTEGDVARISAFGGLPVSTSDPERVFSSEQVERFLMAFSVELTGEDEEEDSAETREKDPGFDPFGKGKGKGKGWQTPTDPE
jgi:hypothetical protein